MPLKRIDVQKNSTPLMTIIMILILAALLVASFHQISVILEQRCIVRMEEGVDTVINEVASKLNNDSRILNAAASILSSVEINNMESFKSILSTFTPLMDSMRMRVLLPNNTIVQPDGTTTDASAGLSFEQEAPLGEHISNRMVSTTEPDTAYILRHYVPIIRNGETTALLYGVTPLSELPSVMNISNIYDGAASAYIIDTETGDYILDTLHDTLGNVSDFYDHQSRDGELWEQRLADIRSGKRGYTVFKATDEEWMYFYYSPSTINKWAICVSVPESIAFESLYAIRHVFWFIGIIMSIVISLYYLWVLRDSKHALQQAVEQVVLRERLEKAEAAERAKTLFLNNMSHDIRTPMNAIIGFTTLAQANSSNERRVQEYLAKIISSSNHLLSLINDVLDMSRIESGKLHIDEKECTISEIFRDMRNIIQSQMRSKQLEFHMDTIDVVNEDIYCDKLHLNQLLLNLLSNAVKFTPAGGMVSMTIRQKQDAPKGYGAYEIRVKDTGIGMSPEFLEHIFEPFERERTSTVSGIQGTGLGMSIAKSITEAMGGTIKVQSREGKGTEFIINLQFRLMPDRKKTTPTQELGGLRALVVDDNYSTCDSLSRMLMHIGMYSEWTQYGKEAVERARYAIDIGAAFHVFIVDWRLPDLSGVEVVRQLREIVGSDVPIVIITTYDWGEISEAALAAGATTYCSKPLFLSDLRDTLANAIHNGGAPEFEDMSLPSAAEMLKDTRLLLVDDNELNREIAVEILSEAGFLVDTANDGTVAVETIANAPADKYGLVLMDIQMPIMDGYEATRHIRAMEDKQKANIPIVAMTANAFAEDRQRALDAGMNEHVVKPIDVEKLIGVLNQILSKQAR